MKDRQLRILFAIQTALLMGASVGLASPTHRWWKPHRWLSEVNREPLPADCFKPKVDDASFIIRISCVQPASLKFLVVNLPSGENYEFDLCLEHGEIRRLETKGKP